MLHIVLTAPPAFVDMRFSDALVFSLSCYRYLGDGGTDQREILHHGTIGPNKSSPLLGAVSFWGLLPQGSPNAKFWA